MRALACAALVLAGSEGGAQCVLAAIDRPVTAAVRRPALVANRAVHWSVEAVAAAGGYGPFVAAPAMYFSGAEGSTLRADGQDALRALLVSSVATGLLKTAFGRARPFVSADSNACSFGFARGRRRDEFRSMPSGHTSAAFAFAAAMVANRRVSAPVGYGGATLVGLARIYQDKHWLTDILAGAAIGIAAGQAMAR